MPPTGDPFAQSCVRRGATGRDTCDSCRTTRHSTNDPESAVPIDRNPNFGNTTSRYSPFNRRLGARVTF
jgi:hypothetical protein